MGSRNVVGPGSITINTSFSRKFRTREKQTLELRAEVFNLPNHFNPPQPEVNLTSSTFAKSIQAFTGAPKISFTGLERTIRSH